jgi:hypothetical protein
MDVSQSAQIVLFRKERQLCQDPCRRREIGKDHGIFPDSEERRIYKEDDAVDCKWAATERHGFG